MTTTDNPIETIKSTTENLAGHLGECAETYLQLGMVEATQKVTVAASAMLTSLFILPLCLFALLFFGFGSAFWLGEVLHDLKAGFFIVGGFFALCALIYAACRKKIAFPFFRDYLVKKIYE